MSSRVEAYHNAAITIQCMVRKYIAIKKVSAVAKRAWRRVFNASMKKYYWYNRITGTSSATTPKFLVLYTPEDHQVSLPHHLLPNLSSRPPSKLKRLFAVFLQDVV